MVRRKKFTIVVVAVGVLTSAGMILGLNGYFGGGSSIPEDTFTRGLVAYYSFDEGSGTTAYNAADTGTVNDGTITGAKYTTGKKGGALQFDGVDDYVDCGNDDNLQLDKDLTLEFWIKPNLLGAYRENPLDKSYGGEFALTLEDDPEAGRLSYYHGTQRSSGFYWGWTALDNDTIKNNQWQHIVITRKTTGREMKSYYNGDFKKSAQYSSDANKLPSTSSYDFLIGDGYSHNFNGLIDEVRIYDRALSAEEVRHHYNRGAPVAHWSFDEGQGTTTWDGTDNNNDGVLGDGACQPGTSTCPSWVSGKHGSALSFYDDDYTSVPDHSTLDITDAITVSAWMKSAVDTWSYKKTITLSPVTPEINYQVKIELDSSNFDYSHAQDDGDDLRFYNTSNAPLDYWIEEWDTSSTSTIWVEVDSSGTNTIYMYYGNSSASSVSNGTNTFPDFFDDFEDNDITDWTETEPVSPSSDHHYGVGQYSAKIGDTSQTSGHINKDLTATTDIIRVNVFFASNGDALNFIYNGNGVYDINVGTRYGYLSYYDGSWHTGSAISIGEWHTFEVSDIRWAGSYTYDFWVDGVKKWDDISMRPIASHNNVISLLGRAAYVYHDNVLVRKYASSEPIATVGSETTALGILKDDAYGIGINTINASASINDQIITGTVSSGWNYITLTYDKDIGGTEEIKLYVNGIKKTTGDYSTAISTNSNSFLIGNLFDGVIDDVKIYNYARSADEIRLDYNAGYAAKFGGLGVVDCSKDPASCMSKGLVGYWGFDEGEGSTAYNAADTGTVNDGTITGAKYVTGKKGGALNFDGNDRIDCGSDDSLDYTEFTTEAWFKISAFSAHGGIVARSRPNSIRTHSSDGDLYTYIYHTNDIYSANAWDTNLQLDKWYHVAFMFKKPTISLYIDGVLFDTVAFDYDLMQTFGSVEIGELWGYYFHGQIDEVKIYDRALSAEEVRHHYNRGAPVAHWSFDEGQGTTTWDGTDNDNDGTLSDGSCQPGTSTCPSWVSGKHGSALSFDGSNDYVEVASQFSYDVYTFTFWFKSNEATPAANPRFITPTDTHWVIWDRGDGVGFYNTNALANEPRQGIWEFYTVVFNRANSYAWAYRNGVLEGEDSVGRSSPTGNWIIGHNENTGNILDTINGSIDDVRIYNYARSADEIRLDYNAGYAAKFGGLSVSDTDRQCSVDPASCMSKGLVGYWGFDEGEGATAYNAADTGSVNDGTLTNDPKWTQGKKGGALSFDGENDYVEVADNDSLDITNKITMEAWVNVIDPSVESVIVQKHNSTGYAHSNYAMEIRSNQLRVWFGDGTNYRIYSGGSPATGWIHVVGVISSANDIKGYINGIEVSGSYSGSATTITANNQILKIGLKTISYGGFNGEIDEVRIYDRALSAEEVRHHYNRGAPVAHWSFDEGQGTTTWDGTENNNDGRLGSGSCQPGASTCPSWIAGKHGSALDFDGTDDYVLVPDDDTLDITDAITISAWVKPNILSGRIIFDFSWGSRRGYRFLFESNTARACFGNGTDVVNIDVPESKTPIGEWHYWTATFIGNDLSNNAKFYLDGVLEDEGTLSGVIETDPDSILIGRADWGSYFNGQIDDVKIYNYARTQEQILMDYNKGLGAHFE